MLIILCQKSLCDWLSVVQGYASGMTTSNYDLITVYASSIFCAELKL